MLLGGNGSKYVTERCLKSRRVKRVSASSLTITCSDYKKHLQRGIGIHHLPSTTPADDEEQPICHQHAS